MKDITTEEAVNELKERIRTLNRHIKNYEESKCETNIYIQLKKESKAIEKVLNELESLQFKYRARAERLNTKIEKKDKIINAMALQLSGISIWDDQKEEPLILMTEEEVKEYFERKVKDE